MLDFLALQPVPCPYPRLCCLDECPTHDQEEPDDDHERYGGEKDPYIDVHEALFALAAFVPAPRDGGRFFRGATDDPRGYVGVRTSFQVLGRK